MGRGTLASLSIHAFSAVVVGAFLFASVASSAQQPVVRIGAVRLHDIPKPVIAPFIIDAEIQGTPRDDRSSGVTNLNYLSSSITLRRDLEVFQRLRPFEKLVMLHGPALNDIPGVRERLREVVSDFDVELTLVEIRKRADEALPRIPPDAEAVYVNALVQLVEGELEKLATGLIERRLPSFSRLGRAEVERGLLMSLTEDVFDRRARRVALNVQRALLGEDPATFPVDFVMREELVINMSTARAINVFPSFALETVAQLIQDERPEEGRRLNLVLVADEALAASSLSTPKSLPARRTSPLRSLGSSPSWTWWPRAPSSMATGLKRRGNRSTSLDPDSR